jgi:D-galactose 1-dehydrogenase
VAHARRWAAGRALDRVRIEWKEDVRRWHPGQDWIWQPGGLGVFDPGINALSIATLILPPFFVTSAELEFPTNRAAPIAATLAFNLADGAAMSAAFDWRQIGPQSWDIRIDARDGSTLHLSKGGDALTIDGEPVALAPGREYASIYDSFANLIANRCSDVDVRPLQHVADAFMLGRHIAVAPFHDG